MIMSNAWSCSQARLHWISLTQTDGIDTDTVCYYPSISCGLDLNHLYCEMQYCPNQATYLLQLIKSHYSFRSFSTQIGPFISAQ